MNTETKIENIQEKVSMTYPPYPPNLYLLPVPLAVNIDKPRGTNRTHPYPSTCTTSNKQDFRQKDIQNPAKTTNNSQKLQNYMLNATIFTNYEDCKISQSYFM